MPVSLGDWRVRIGTFVRRKRKEYDYNYFLRKLLNLVKNIEKAKHPETNIPDRNTSSQTGLSDDGNSSGNNAAGQNASSRNVTQTGASCVENNPTGMKDEATPKTQSTCDTDSRECITAPKNDSQRDAKITDHSAPPHSSFAENNSNPTSYKNNAVPVNTDEENRVTRPPSENHEKGHSQYFMSFYSGMSEVKATRYPSNNEHKNEEAACPVLVDDDELDCRDITLRPLIHHNQLANKTDPTANLPRFLRPLATSEEDSCPAYESVSSLTTGDNDGLIRYPPAGLDGMFTHRGTTLPQEKLQCRSRSTTKVEPGKNIKEIETKEGKDCSDTNSILLLRAGDVEQNPGPNETSGHLNEDELYLLTDDIAPKDFMTVGIALNFSAAKVEQFKYDNGTIKEAAFKMLLEWRGKVRDVEARRTLISALENHQLIQLAEKLKTGQTGEDIRSLTEEEIHQVAEDVKRYFAIELCQIQADPINSELLLEFDHIFTNLALMQEDKSTKKKKPLSYSDLLTTKVNGIYPRRLLVEGEGGVGKTTLCAKIAWDWIHGVGYKDFKLVLVILLRMAKDKTVGEVVKSYLSDNNHVTAKQLDKYILTHPDDVFLVLDGLDELAMDLDSIQQLIQIIINRLFKSGTVLITSRQWRSDEIRNSSDLRKAFAFIAVEGFSAEHRASYITKFLHPDTAAAKELIRFISDNDVIQDTMAPYPIYTVILCILWRESDGGRRQAMSKSLTFSQLFDEVIRFLIDHYLSKHSASPVGPALIHRHLTQISCVAFQGLTERRLVFSEEEFHSCPESVDTSCKVGVLSRQKRIPLRRERRDNPHSLISSVQFRHKLFQEYLTGMYLASIYESNRSDYDKAMDNILKAAWEYQYLLYFTSSRQKEIGLDIVSRLMAKRERGSRNYMYDMDGGMRKHGSMYGMYDRYDRYDMYDRRSGVSESFIVDVAYESQDQDVAKAVVDQLIDKAGTTLEVKEKMQAHTIAGHLFLVHHSQVDEIIVEKSCGRTVSDDLAEFMCTSRSLRSVTIKKAMHDVFYSVLAKKAAQSKIKTLRFPGVDLSERSSASRDLAHFICKMPHLEELTLYRVHDDFHYTSSSMASSAKIKTLGISNMDLGKHPSTSRDLAQFVCKMPHLNELTLCRVHDDFYSTASSMASSAMIETLYIWRINLCKRPSASRDLAQFICKMPHLKKLYLGSSLSYDDDFYSTASSMVSSAKVLMTHLFSGALQWSLGSFLSYDDKAILHDDFFSTASSMASSSKIKILSIEGMDLSKKPSASRDFAQFICEMPHFKNLTLDRVHDDFCSTASSMASSAKIKTLRIRNMDLIKRSSASRDLAQFICKLPQLKYLLLGSSLDDSKVMLHDDFYSATSSMATSVKIETLDISGMDLRKRPSASRYLAQFICKMPHLKNLTIENEVMLHGDFYSTISSLASSVKIETLDNQTMGLIKCSSASRDLAQFICKMPQLKKLIFRKYDEVVLNEVFYSTASSVASSAKIETLCIHGMELRKCSSASRDLAQFICKMPHLRKLSFGSFGGEVVLHDDFYSTASSMASSAKIEELDIDSMDLSERSLASRDLAQFICKMPYLKNLSLDKVHGDFYSSASSMASSAMIETLHMFRMDLSERSSESRDLAKFICKMPYLEYLRIKRVHDDFYSTASSMASSAMIEEFDIMSMDLSERSSASRDLAQFICKMPHLKNLEIRPIIDKVVAHNDFYSTASSMASSAKIEHLDVNMDLTERSSASLDLAQFIVKMPNLKKLTLEKVHDDFYSAASSMASSVKIETLETIRMDLSKRSSASRDLAQFICTMPHLKNLTLYRVHDDFFSTASSMVSSAKIETLKIGTKLRKSSSASRDLAQFICKMPHLKKLTIDMFSEVHHDFFSTASSMASSAKIETLHINMIKRKDLSERSSERDLAQFICRMPHLKHLTLYRVHDDLLSTASSMASSVKIETLCIGGTDLSECSTGSRDLAQFICKMPHLKNLTLGTYSQYDPKVLLHDDFYSTASSAASSAKIETLSIMRTAISGRRCASQDLAHFICKMPYLKHLRLFFSKFHQDFWSKSLAASQHGEEEDDKASNTSLTLTELTVDDNTLHKLRDCVSMLNTLKKITLQANDEIRSDVIQRIHLPRVTELTIQTNEYTHWPAEFMEEPCKISDAMQIACPQLIKVTFNDITIGNRKIEPILEAFRSTHHKYLKTISFVRCWTDDSVDALITEFSQDQMMVEFEHGKPSKARRILSIG